MKSFFRILLLSGVTVSATAQHTKYIQAVDEYVPAPGQFVNTLPEYEEGNTAFDMEQKCTDALADNRRGLVTLGAYGGYITFHFDHPVANVAGQKDFAIWGNTFYDSSEPAIVMVSVDENGNGMPDDTWYELAGSEYNNPATTHNYMITYKFESSLKDIAWRDNREQSGSIARNEYHEQEYFPLWLCGGGDLTFQGTLLPGNATLMGTTYILSEYEYGYADNYPNNVKDGCSMNIEWAVDAEGNSVELDHIDFVRCYTGVNQYCGPIGETSSEISGAEDLHLEESIAIATAINTMPQQRADVVARYDLSGRQLQGSVKGIQLVRMSDGRIIKQFK